MKKKILLSLLFLLLPISVFAVTTDNTPPVLKNISFKETVDLKPNQKVYIDLDATDDVSGIETIYLVAVRMTNGKYENYGFNTEDVNIYMRVYYDEDKKPYIVIPYNYLSGNYLINQVELFDYEDNRSYYYYKEYPSTIVSNMPYNEFDFSVKFSVKSDTDDITPPKLATFSFSKETINLGESFRITVKATDDNGFKFATVKLVDINGDSDYIDIPSVDGIAMIDYTPTGLNGKYLLESIRLEDIYRNYSLYFNTKYMSIYSPQSGYAENDYQFGNLPETYITINGVEAVKDTTPPVLKSITINKNNFSIPSYGLIEMIAEDNVGLSDSATVSFVNKNGDEIIANLNYVDGKYVGEIEFNQYLSTGDYYLDYVGFNDVSHNTQMYFKGDNKYKTADLNIDLNINLTSRFNTDITTSTVAYDLLSKIKSSKNDASVSIDATVNSIISKDVFEAIKGTDRKIYIESNGIIWIFNGKDITNPKDVNTKLLVTYGSEISNLSEYTDKSLVLNFADNGELPGKATVIIKLDYALRNFIGNSVYVYYYDDESNSNKFQAITSDPLKQANSGYFEFSITHNSKYVLSTTKIAEKYVVNNVNTNTNLFENIKENIILYSSIFGGVIIITIGIIIIVKKNKKMKKDKNYNIENTASIDFLNKNINK